MDWISPSIPSLLNGLILLALKATALLGLAFFISVFLKKASASTRHFLMSAIILVVSGLPLLAPMAPDVMLPVPKIIRTHITTEIPLKLTATADVKGPEKSTTVKPLDSSEPRPLSASNHFLDLLIYLWVLGIAVAAGRVLIGSIGCARNRRKAKQVESKTILALVDRISFKTGLRRSPAVMFSERTTVAYVSGITRPVLFLPFHVLKWPEDRLVSVLFHELAHIKRKDHITWPLINLVVSWLWFNPLLWVILAGIRRDKEKACDDYAISNTHVKDRYARHLLEVYTFLKSPDRVALVNLSFARKNQVKDRIMHILNHGIDHRPISRIKQFVYSFLLVIVAVPLISIRGFSTDIALHDVTPQEREAVVTTLQGFYSELSRGSEYQSTRSRFLTSDYFGDPALTLENLDQATRRPPFENTLMLISEEGVAPAKEFRSRITAIQRDGDELVATQEIDVITDRIRGEVIRGEDGTIIRVPRSDSLNPKAVEECHLVNSLTQQIRLKREDGSWKISEFNDGVAIMRMDTDNPYGPIFLIWMEDIDEQTTPFGAGVFKVFPSELIPDARNTKFVLEK